LTRPVIYIYPLDKITALYKTVCNIEFIGEFTVEFKESSSTPGCCR
jgi:hypothetical protein